MCVQRSAPKQKEKDMGLFGDLLSVPFKIVNIPLKVTENLMSAVTDSDCSDTISKPLNEVAKEIKKVDD
jgi:hypothetical protein